MLSCRKAAENLGRRRLGCALAVTGAIVLSGTVADAAIVGVSASSYTISFDSGFGPVDVSGPMPIPAWAPSITYDKTLANNANTSRGIAGESTFFHPLGAGFGFPLGTGVTQDWISGGHAAATLRIDFTATYLVVGGFGPDTISYANFPLIGTVSEGGRVAFSYGATFTGSNPEGAILGGELHRDFVRTKPGDFTKRLREKHRNGNYVAGNGTIDLVGFIEFSAFDGHNPSTSAIHLQDNFAGSLPEPAPVPLPATAPLLMVAIGGLHALRRRRVARRQAR